ncbi:hypothetical protein HYC85_001876 [Camellia sinensis]|uniref:Myosin motor domain-containing protein n=1 Tax=Camellia sinensis TaxID=4442 RepID=A0A7J7I7W1_CAMSI|nr:hypothetical protein HYC85_001876 [Camellia sinensis]
MRFVCGDLQNMKSNPTVAELSHVLEYLNIFKVLVHVIYLKADDAGYEAARLRFCSNPVLEAFGNAKTVRNNNSSTTRGSLQISQEVAKYKLGDPKSFHYLNQSNCYDLVCISDAHDYLATRRAMDIVGISQKDQDAIFRVVAAILHLGNVEFTKGKEIDSSVLKYDKSKFHLQTAADLLMCDLGALEDALLKRVMITPEEVIRRSLDPVQATVSRDGLAKTIYYRLFDWLVDTINVSIGQDPNLNDIQFPGLTTLFLDVVTSPAGETSLQLGLDSRSHGSKSEPKSPNPANRFEKTDFRKKCQTWTALPDTESPPKYFILGNLGNPDSVPKGHVSVITKVASARELGYDWGRSLREHPRSPVRCLEVRARGHANRGNGKI